MQQIVNLRFSRINRDSILEDPYTTPVQRAQAYADFYQEIRIAHAQGMPPNEIQTGAGISRQRLWQILHSPRTSPPPRTTDVHLPKEDV